MNNEFSKKFRIGELTLFEFTHWLVSVRPSQPTIGSLVISLKRPCGELQLLEEVETRELKLVFQKIEQLLNAAFGFDKINYLCLMMVDNQVHFHVVPRYEKEILFDKKTYKDGSWPGPIDIIQSIDEPGIELKVLNYLQKFNLKYKPVVGYTTGVFDMFHIGHLKVLKRAKNECDYLIVGVTTDELSISRKGKKPIISQVERMQIVKNISFVDQVVPQENMDKFSAWEKYRFDKMFVGSDWKGTDKWNQIEIDFAKIDVEIVYFPYTDTTSSSELRKALNKINSI